jgi:hypothetical protein
MVGTFAKINFGDVARKIKSLGFGEPELHAITHTCSVGAALVKISEMLGGLLWCVARVFPIEAFNAARCVEQLLLTGEKWVAVGANFDAQHVALHCGLGLERMSASAVNVNFVVIGMDAGFHCYLPCQRPVCTAKGEKIPKARRLVTGG